MMKDSKNENKDKKKKEKDYYHLLPHHSIIISRINLLMLRQGRKSPATLSIYTR